MRISPEKYFTLDSFINDTQEIFEKYYIYDYYDNIIKIIIIIFLNFI